MEQNCNLATVMNGGIKPPVLKEKEFIEGLIQAREDGANFVPDPQTSSRSKAAEPEVYPTTVGEDFSADLKHEPC